MSRAVKFIGVGGSALAVGMAMKFSLCEDAKMLRTTESPQIIIRPKSDEYTVVDWKGGKAAKFLPNHALHETLQGENKVEIYEVYKHNTKAEIMGIVKFGNSLNGYPGIVHGGRLVMKG